MTVPTPHARVRRSQMSPEEWIRHRKLRKKIASAKWYDLKKKREQQCQYNHARILEANLRDLLNPTQPWNQIHDLYEWCQWPWHKRDYTIPVIWDLRIHPHAPCLEAIRSQIVVTTRPLMDTIWRNIPWDSVVFRHRLTYLVWMQHRQLHQHVGPGPVHDRCTGSHDTSSYRSVSCASTWCCAMHSVWMASVPGVCFTALTMVYETMPRNDFCHMWRLLSHCLLHITHPSNPKDILLQPYMSQCSNNTMYPPNQTPIQKLEHIASNHTSVLNPRSILLRWIQDHCFPHAVSTLYSYFRSADPTTMSWWEQLDEDVSDSEAEGPLSQASLSTNEYETRYWDALCASDCESSSQVSVDSLPSQPTELDHLNDRDYELADTGEQLHPVGYADSETTTGPLPIPACTESDASTNRE